MGFKRVALALLLLGGCKAPDQTGYFGPGTAECVGSLTVNLQLLAAPPTKVKVVIYNLGGVVLDECAGDTQISRSPTNKLHFRHRDTGFTPPEIVTFSVFDQDNCSGVSTALYNAIAEPVASPAPARCDVVSVDIVQ